MKGGEKKRNQKKKTKSLISEFDDCVRIQRINVEGQRNRRKRTRLTWRRGEERRKEGED